LRSPTSTTARPGACLVRGGEPGNDGADATCALATQTSLTRSVEHTALATHLAILLLQLLHLGLQLLPNLFGDGLAVNQLCKGRVQGYISFERRLSQYGALWIGGLPQQKARTMDSFAKRSPLTTANLQTLRQRKCDEPAAAAERSGDGRGPWPYCEVEEPPLPEAACWEPEEAQLHGQAALPPSMCERSW
jgi:hypothetical protein